MNRRVVPYLLTAALVPLASNTGARSLPTIEIEDAIRMTRIQKAYGRGEDMVFSPDGSKLACVVWRGDITKDRNIHSLLVFDLRRSPVTAEVLVSDTYLPDPEDQHSTPISYVRFLSDRTLAFLGALNGTRAQVYGVDLETRELRVIASHPTAIQSYGASTDGKVVAFSALSAPDERILGEMSRSGFPVFEGRLPTPFSVTEALPGLGGPTPQYYWSVLQVYAMARTAFGRWFTPVREYFLAGGAAAPKRLLDRSAGHFAAELDEKLLVSVPDLAVSPSGSHAVVFPFRRTGRDRWSAYRYFREHRYPYMLDMVGSIGLVDLRTGNVEPLLDTPVEIYSRAPPLWAPDGRSVIVRSVLPPADPGALESEPSLLEVDISTRRARAIPKSAGWQPVSWQQPDSVVVRRSGAIGISIKRDSQWQPVSELGTRADTGFNHRFGLATNGSVIAGVKDALTAPPELAVYDIASRRTTVLTDLNPDLRQRTYAAVEKVFWPGPAHDTAFGYLVKPVGFVQGKRYPAVILLKDEGSSDTSDDSFVIDGQQQLNGWAIQTFAARGLLVLLTPAPPSLREVALTPGEGPRIVAHVQNAVTYLADRGLIDPERVGISGWSRAAFWTDYILTHSAFEFAAATDIDGGGNYKDFQQRWMAADDERDAAGRFQLDVRSVRTPLLSEQYGPVALIGQGEFIMALRVLGKPVDLYYYPDAPHSLKRPMHRLNSLRRHLDWFRFWLQDYEDPDPRKTIQYERWRKLRALKSGQTSGQR